MLWRKAYGYRREAARREVACVFRKLTAIGWFFFFLLVILTFGSITRFAS